MPTLLTRPANPSASAPPLPLATPVGVAVGAAIRVAWRWRHPRGADAYAALVGAALVAGDGVWAVGRGLLAAFGAQAPICMSFSYTRASAASPAVSG
jgi:NO-binding membrane sensor protein with MHYT domain